jgi:DHA1 family bicyclomycin/chloramphenicol resistance-like MFS transporter
MSTAALLGFAQMSGASVIVGLLQLTALDAAQQLTILMLSLVPIYCLYKMPSVKQKITFVESVT